ncbi:MAG: LysR family transcriptional regulator [Nannocystales bacterium]
MASLDRLTLDQLRVWVAVVEAGSFSAAGRRLGKVQSAISQSVATLEDSLGIVVFDREAGKGALTPAGAALFPQVRGVLASVARLGGHARALDAGREAELSIVCDAVFPRAVLVTLASKLAVEFPDIALRTETEVLQGVVQRVEVGACRLGVIGPDVEVPESLERTSAGAVQMVPVVAPSHPLAGRASSDAALTEHVQLVLQGVHGGDAPDRAVLSPRTWRVGDLSIKAAMLRAGLGWGNLPMPEIAADLERGTLVRLQVDAWADHAHDLGLSVVYRRDEGLGPVATWTIRTLRSLCSRG